MVMFPLINNRYDVLQQKNASQGVAWRMMEKDGESIKVGENAHLPRRMSHRH